MFFRDRPSVNSVLKIPFVQKRVPKFLTDDVSYYVLRNVFTLEMLLIN